MKLVHNSCALISKHQIASQIDQIEHQIDFAQQKLLEPTIPLQIRAISYVRICSHAMQKHHRSTAPYLSLLKSLSEQQIDWWNACEASSDGLLESSHSTINTLLQPINAFVKEQFVPLAA